MQTSSCGWTGEEYNIAIEITAKEGQPAFNVKQLRRIRLQVIQAWPKLRPKPDEMIVTIGGKKCHIQLTYKRRSIERGYGTTNSSKIEQRILAALRERLPGL